MVRIDEEKRDIEPGIMMRTSPYAPRFPNNRLPTLTIVLPSSTARA